jgi:hypothetical protein
MKKVLCPTDAQYRPAPSKSAQSLSAPPALFLPWGRSVRAVRPRQGRGGPIPVASS